MRLKWFLLSILCLCLAACYNGMPRPGSFIVSAPNGAVSEANILGQVLCLNAPHQKKQCLHFNLNNHYHVTNPITTGGWPFIAREGHYTYDVAYAILSRAYLTLRWHGGKLPMTLNFARPGRGTFTARLSKNKRFSGTFYLIDRRHSRSIAQEEQDLQ